MGMLFGISTERAGVRLRIKFLVGMFNDVLGD